MSQQRLKIEVARAALKHVEEGMLLGVGTGSTVNAFIDELGSSGIRLEGAVSSSEATTEKLKSIGVDVVDLNRTGDLSALHRRRRRIRPASPPDQGRRRGAHAREDHRRGQQALRLHRRCQASG